MKKILFILITFAFSFTSIAQDSTASLYASGIFSSTGVAHNWLSGTTIWTTNKVSTLSDVIGKKKDGGLTIGKAIEMITPENFNPDTAVFKIIAISDSTVTFYYWLRELTVGQNHTGKTVRDGNAIVPKSYVDALQVRYDGSVGSNAALVALLAGFNLKLRD
jgi:hypothetical protein